MDRSAGGEFPSSFLSSGECVRLSARMGIWSAMGLSPHQADTVHGCQKTPQGTEKSGGTSYWHEMEAAECPWAAGATLTSQLKGFAAVWKVEECSREAAVGKGLGVDAPDVKQRGRG